MSLTIVEPRNEKIIGKNRYTEVVCGCGLRYFTRIILKFVKVKKCRICNIRGAQLASRRAHRARRLSRTSKICSYCKKELKIEQFSLSRTERRNTYCKLCQCKISRNYYLRNTDRIQLKTSEYLYKTKYGAGAEQAKQINELKKLLRSV